MAEETVRDFELLVVHSLFRGHAPWAGALAIRRGRPHWTVPHGCLDPWGMSRRALAKQTWLRMHGRVVFDEARYVIFSSRREQEKASRWGSRRNGVVVHWPTCPPPPNRAELAAGFRLRHSIPQHARVLLFLGRLHSMKRVRETVSVFCRAIADNCHLVVAGPDGDTSAQAIRAAIPERWADRIHVVGPVAGVDLDAARSAADGFISLSHRENFGYSAADALAWRQPVILSTGHDVVHEMPRETTGALACGWLIPDDFADPATEAIRAFASLPERRLSEMADAGGTWAEDRLSFDRFRAALMTLLANS
jgi:glycosyltransferase involved in cell wall biosynthesis